MSKRKEKQKALLLQRIRDIYNGAVGRLWVKDDEWLSLEEAERVVPALRDVFGQPVENWWAYQPHVIGKFETPEKACDHLFEQGIRHNKRETPSD